MKMTIRQGVFETNSSSVHSLTMCNQDDYNKWVNGEFLRCTLRGRLWDREAGQFIKIDFPRFASKETYTELIKTVLPDIDDDYLTDNDDFQTYEQYSECDDNYEHFEDTYTTKSGEVIIAFGYYGNNN
jgi:hypothetical protein